jgi:hypothetical protein
MLGLIEACSSAGPYGHSIDYAPLSDEEDALRNSVEYDPVMSTRDPVHWKTKNVSVFGVVKRRTHARGGMATELILSVRALAPRNLCEETGEDTCRVTVSEREHGELKVLVRLRPEDDTGRQRIEPESLVRVIGVLIDDRAPGKLALRGGYYRHWPRDEFVTTLARSYMLR